MSMSVVKIRLVIIHLVCVSFILHPAKCRSHCTGGQAFSIFLREVTPDGTYHPAGWAVNVVNRKT